MKTLSNKYGETRTLKYDKFFKVSSSTLTNEYINTNSKQQAIESFLKLHPKVKYVNSIECDEIELPPWVDINKVIEA